MKPTFNSKETYLQWRTDWRARYRELSRDIRYLRLLAAARQSGIGNPRWDNCRPHLIETAKKFTNKETGVCNVYGHLFLLRDEARQMLEWRKESKVMAQAQYAAAHAAAAA